MSRGFPWSRLGIEPTNDPAAIRKAYADALRATNLDEDIAGYAELRRARDQALWLAARSAEDAEDEDEGDYGLGGLADPDDGWVDPEEEDERPWDIVAYDRAAFGEPGPVDAFPEDSGPAEPQRSEAEERAQAAWRALLMLLFPDGEPSDEAVTAEEYEEGMAALGTLVARAEEADIAEQAELDSALADLFARTWPRSAPFVERANAAFGWLDEAGALEERPALMFLNQRLKGMRFHEKVQQPDHPLHRAWTELARPGRAGMLDRLRVNRVAVHKLLTGIRERYPELESLLDAERVASWERASLVERSGGLGALLVRGAVLLVIGVMALGFISGLLGLDDDGEDPGLPQIVEIGPSEAEMNAAIADMFGPGTDMAAVKQADPVFAVQLLSAFKREDDNDGVLAFVRHKVHGSAGTAAFEALVLRGELRGLWMQAALRQSAEVCRNIMVADFESVPLELTPAEREREQKLLRRMLDAKVLGHIARGGEFRYDIPGWLVADTMERSGLSRDRLVAALTDPDNADRCKAEAGLIAATLKSPGRVSRELLQAL